MPSDPPTARIGLDRGSAPKPPRPPAPPRDEDARPRPVGLHGRYVIGDEIAAGGMATVHLGRMLGDAGFARTVAIKRLHPQLAKDPEVCAMLLDEGRLAARIHHLNVVTTLDVVASGDELFVVMEYVHGEALSALIRAAIRRGERMPPRVVAAVLSGALRGLHAAHEARDPQGDPLGVVHRDVSPQNILVGSDGMARVLDFGIAKAAGRMHVTQDGRIKGKFGYMPPEQLHAEVLDRRTDVYAAGVVLWEALVGARLFAGKGQTPDFARLLNPVVDPPSTRARGLSAYDAVVMRALSREAEGRFPTALAMAEALEACGPVAPTAVVGAWVMDVAGELLAERAARIAAVESRLMTSIRDSLHVIEASDLRVNHVAGAAGTASTGPAPPIPRSGSPPPPAPEGAAAGAGIAPGPSDRPPAPAAPVPASSGASSGRDAALRRAGPIPCPAAARRRPGWAPRSSARSRSRRRSWSSRPSPRRPRARRPPRARRRPRAPPPRPRRRARPPRSSPWPPRPSPRPPPPRASCPRARPPPSPRRRPPPTRHAGRGLPSAAGAAGAGAACSPPFTIDGEGHKKYKLECLR